MKRIILLFLALCLCVGLSACKSSEAKKVDELILSIGEVSLDSKNAIQDAQSYYDTLTEEQKAEVENYPVLQSASETLESLERVAVVEDAINAIGTVTLDSEPLITAAQTALNALSEEEKALVSEDSRNTLASAQLTFVEIASSIHWEVAYYVDNFGDETDSAYVRGSFEGKFSNSATSGSELSVIVFYDAQYKCFSFRLLEYGSHVANWNYYDVDDFEIMLKINGTEYSGRPSSVMENDIYIFEHTSNLYQTILNALQNGDEISFVIEASRYSTSRYRFTLDGVGFADICEEVQ